MVNNNENDGRVGQSREIGTTVFIFLINKLKWRTCVCFCCWEKDHKNFLNTDEVCYFFMQTRSDSKIPSGWTATQEKAYQKLYLSGEKSSMTTALVRKNLLGSHGEKPSMKHHKAHIIDCEMVIEALKRMSGRIPSRQYFADLADLLCQESNWRWLRDYKNAPRCDDVYINDHSLAKKLISGDKVRLSSHEASKVRKQIRILLENKGILPDAFVLSYVKLITNAYDENGKKMLNLNSLGLNSWQVFQREHKGHGMSRAEMSSAYRSLQSARPSSTLSTPSVRTSHSTGRASSSWDSFRSEHKGQGMSRAEMSSAYRSLESARPSSVSTPSVYTSHSTGRASSSWDSFRSEHKGQGMSRAEMSAVYQASKG
jgi:hypothetical protein